MTQNIKRPLHADSDDHWGKGSRDPAERQFLKGPQPRGLELAEAARIFGECVKGFRHLHFVGPCVTVFGSARFKEEHPYYVLARELGAKLAEAGFTVMTGGGPGIMEAANRGAKDVGGYSVGSNITLPIEQKPNRYLDRWVEFRYSSCAKCCSKNTRTLSWPCPGALALWMRCSRRRAHPNREDEGLSASFAG